MQPGRVGVFWDLENVHVPKGSSARSLVEVIRKTVVETNGHEAAFEAFLDVTKINERVAMELQRAGVKLVHVPGGDKNGADIRIIQTINDFVDLHKEGCIIVLLSSDENFLPTASSLRRKPRVKSYLIHNKQVNHALMDAFDGCFLWPSLTQSKTIASSSMDGASVKMVSEAPARKEQKMVPPRARDEGAQSGKPVRDEAHTVACQECNKMFASDPALENHQKSTGHSNSFACEVCNRVFASEQALENHQKSIGHPNSFVCDVCDRVFASEQALENHQKATGHSDLFACEGCEREFASEQALENHRNATGHSALFGCEVCRREFASEQALENHMAATGHSKQFTCEVCNRVFASEQALDSHKSATGHSTSFGCEVCDRVFGSEQALENHQNATGHLESFMCESCNKTFASEQALQSHQGATGHLPGVRVGRWRTEDAGVLLKNYGVNGTMYSVVRYTFGDVTLPTREIVFPVGSKLYVHGLESAEGKPYNQHTGVVVDIDRAKSRYILEFGTPESPIQRSIAAANVIPLG